MVDFRDFQNFRLLRTGCVVLTSAVSFMAHCGETQQVAAGWPAFSAGRKAASSDGAKSPKGFAATIRKLMNEARQHEARGEFDRAISVAERAALISEKTADLNKSAPDIQPEATSQYVRELKRRKVEAQSKKWQVARREPKRPAPVENFDAIFDADLTSNTEAADSTRELDKPAKDSPSVHSDKTTATQEVTLKEWISGESTKAPDARPVVDEGRTASLKTPQPVSSERPAELQSEAHPIADATSEDSPLEVSDTIAMDNRDQIADDLSPVTREESQHADSTSPGNEIKDIFDDEPAPQEPGTVHPLDESAHELPASRSTIDATDILPAELETEDTIVSSVAQTIEDELEFSRSTQTSRRIKLRPRFDSTEPYELTKEFTDEAIAQPNGPTIEPLTDLAVGNTDDAPLPFDPFLESTHIQPVAATLVTEKTAFASVTPEADTANASGATGSTAGDDDNTLNRPDNQPWQNSAEELFPTRQVNELKQRLESAISLQPGEITKSATIDLLSERLVEEMDDQSSIAETASPTDALAQNRDSLFKDHVDFDSSIPSSQSNARTTIVGRTSMIRWRAASHDVEGTHPGRRGLSKSTEQPSDLRQSLREVSTFEPLSETGSRSLFSLPTVKLRIKTETMRNASTGEVGVGTAGSPLTPRAEVKGSLWENAMAPTIDGYSGSIAGGTMSGAVSNDDPASAPLPPPGPSVAQTSFDSPDASYNRFGTSKSARTTGLTLQSGKVFDAALATSETSQGFERPEMAVKNASFKKPSLKSRSDQIDGATASSHELLTNGPIERVASLCGISTSTASTILGIIGMAMVISGLWTVRAIVRSSLK